MAVTRAVIDIDINTSSAAASLRSLQNQVNAFQTALNRGNLVQGAAAKEYASSLSQLVNMTGYFTAESVRMRTSAAQLDDTLRKGKGSIGQYFRSLKQGTAEYAAVTSLAQQRAAALQTQFVATGAAAGGYRDAIAIRPITAFNDAAAVSNQRLQVQRALFNQATTSMINFGKNTQWAGRQLMVGFTVPLTIFGTLAGKTFMDLEKSAISFKKVYGDAFTTPDELEANFQAVKKLSGEFTKYGIAAKDTMEMAAQAAAAGAQNADLIDATTEATRLATLGQMEQTKALEATISLQNAFGLSSEKLSKSINFMNMVENQTVLTLQDMADAIPRVAPVIKGLGGTVEDMAAMLAAMKEGGVGAAQGANALKSGLASLINPTNRAIESLGKMGINLNNIIQTNKGDLMGTVQAFAVELGKLDKLAQQQVLENVFGKYQYARLGALFKNIIKDGTQASRVLEMAGMSAQQMAQTAEKELGIIAESPATKFTAAVERMKLAIAPIGEIFVRVATPVIELFTRLLDIFNNLPDGVKNIGAIGTVIVGVLIPTGTMFLGLLMNLVGTLLKFGNIMKLAFSGFAKGGLKGAITSVSQALRYMSLMEIDTAMAAEQLGKAAIDVNGAFQSQVGAAGNATAAIDRLGGAYARLMVRMQEAAEMSGAFAVPGAAMGRARARTQIPVTVVRRNKGGSIPGAGNTDTVPAMLTPGEFVINKEATRKNLPLLHAINNGNVQGLNRGGGVATPGRMGYGRRPVGGYDPDMLRFLREGQALESEQQKQIVEGLRLGLNVGSSQGSRFAIGRASGMGGERAHLDSIFVSPDQARAISTLRPSNQRAAAAAEIAQAFVSGGMDSPVGGLTNNWATVTRRLNQAANRGENEIITIGQAITELAEGRHKLLRREVGPALSMAGITPDNFVDIMIAKLQTYDETGIFSDAVFSRAFREASSDAGKIITPKLTGLRIPTKVDLREVISRATGIPVGAISDDVIRTELAKIGISYEPGKHGMIGVAGSSLTARTGESTPFIFPDINTGIPMNSGGMVPGYAGGGIIGLYKKSLSILAGVRKAGSKSRSSRVFWERSPLVFPYPRMERQDPKTSRGRVWADTNLPEETRRRGTTRKESGTVVGHIYSRQFYERFGSPQGGASPRMSGEKLTRTIDFEGKPLKPDNEYDLLANQYILMDENWNRKLKDGVSRSEWKQIDEYDMLSLLSMLRSNGVPEQDALSIARIAARKINARIASRTDPIDERMFGELVTGSTISALRSSKDILKPYGMNKGGMIPMLSGGGPLFLGKIHPFSAVSKARQQKEAARIKKQQSRTAALQQSDAIAQTGLFADLPVTDLGSIREKLGGRSSVLGLNGIYDAGVFKAADNPLAALAEVRGAHMSGVFGLRSPAQQVIKTTDPKTGKLVVGVLSPYDPSFVGTTAMIDRDSMFDQLLGVLYRRDLDTQPDNLYGSFVADVSQARYKKAASTSAEIIDPGSILDFLPKAFLQEKGGAKKWFMEHTAELARTMTPEEYDAGIRSAIARARGRAKDVTSSLPSATDADKEKYYRDLISDLDELESVDWRAQHGIHSAIYPEVKKPKKGPVAHNAPLTSLFVNAGGMIQKLRRGGIAGIKESLKAWSTSSRYVRENPSLLGPIESLLSISRLPKDTRVSRRTTVGLAKGSEFSPEVADFLLKASPEELAQITSLSMRGPLSTTTGTFGGIDPDVARIMFLREQHAIGRRKHLDDLKAIKSLQSKIASGRGPVELYQRQLAERMARVAGYRDRTHALGKEIKALAPRGYRILDLDMDLPAGTSAFTSRGSYMGKGLDESEIVIGSGRYPISSIQARNSGGPIFDSTKTNKTIVPGAGNTDTVPAMLTPGEFVINKKATAQNKELLHAINNGMSIGGSMQRFARGGEVLANLDRGGFDLVDNEGNVIRHYRTRKDAYRGLLRRKALISPVGFGSSSGLTEDQMMQRSQTRRMGASMGLGALGGAMMMAPMIPAVGQNETLSNMAGMGGIGLSMASMIPMLGKAAGPVGALAAAAAAAGGALYVMRDSLDTTAREAAKVGASLGGAANRMEEMSKATGYQFAKDRVGMRQFRFTKQEAQAASEFSGYFESEAGQKMITDLKELNPQQRYAEVSSIISMAIADGMDEKTAKAYGDAIAFYTSDAMLKQRLFSDIKSGKFNSGSRAMIDMVAQRQAAANTPLIAPPAMASSFISQGLGTSGATNIWGEAAAVTGAMAGAGALAGSIIPGIGTAIGAVAGTLIGGTIAFFKARDAMDQMNKSMETVAKTFGSSIQVLKELDNAEALLLEERRKGILTPKEYIKRQKELDAMRESQAGRVKEAVAISADTGATAQSISDQLTIAGFEEGLAAAVSRSVSREDVAQKLFQQSYEDIDDASKEVVGAVIANVLSGMTPENAASKIAEIETMYAGMANQLLGAAANGLTQAEIDNMTLGEQLSNWANSIFEDIQATDVGYTRRRSNYKDEIAANIAQNDEYFRSLGIGVEEVTTALSSFGDLKLAAKIGLEEEKLQSFAKLVTKLADPKYKQIEVEVATRYMFDRNWTPATLVKKIDDAAKKINKIDFKQFGKNFKEIERMAPSPMAFINFAMTIGTAMKDIPSMYENALKGVDIISDQFKENIKKSGNVKVSVDMLTAINGSPVTNGAQVAKKLNSMFPKGLPPILVPILLQIPNLNLGMRWMGKGGKTTFSQEVADWFAAGNTPEDVGPNTPVSTQGLAAQYYAAWQASQTVSAMDSLQSLFQTPSGGTDQNGSGGAKQKSLFEQLRDQMKFARKMFDAIRELMYNETKKGVRFDKDFKKFIAGPFAPEFLEYLRSQGEEGLKIIKGGMNKVREAYKNFVVARGSELASQLLYLPQTMRAERAVQNRELGMRKRLGDEGRSGAEIDFIVERTAAMREQWQANQDLLKQEQKKPKGKQNKDLIAELKEQNEVIRKRRKFIEDNAAAIMKENQLLEQQSKIQDLSDDLRNSQNILQYMARGLAPELAQQLAEIGSGQMLSDSQVADARQKLLTIKAIAEDPIQLRITILDIQDQIKNIKAEIEIQEKIQKELSDEIAAKGVKSAEQLLDRLNKQNEELSRSIELEQRRLEPIDEAIEKYNKQKEEINKAFDERLKALDEIEKANRRIFDLQQGQLGIAQALSRGDVAAASQASLELQQTLAQNRQQDIRDSLENTRAMQLEAIDKRINDLQKQREDIMKNIKNLQNDQRSIQDQIYTAENAIKDITIQVNEKYDIGVNSLEAQRLKLKQLQNEAAAYIEILREQERLGITPETPGGTGGTGGTGGGGTSSGIPSGGINISDTYWDSTSKQVRLISNNQPVTGTVYNMENRTKKAYVNGYSNGTWTPMMYGGNVKYRGSREQAPGFMMGGRIKRFATGSFVPGIGATDKIPAMLTPGEFVVRKSVAQEFGPLLTSLNGNVFPKMQAGTSIGVNSGAGSNEIQYNYDINVNIAGTNASPDEIANAVMNKIKMTQDRNIRSYRY